MPKLSPHAMSMLTMEKQPLRCRQAITNLQSSLVALLAAVYCVSHAAGFAEPPHWHAGFIRRRDPTKTTTLYSTPTDNVYNYELFSLAPMMGHTNRHYHYFFRLLSTSTHLFTEMTPSSQIVRAFQRARAIYLPAADLHKDIHVEEILQVIQRIRENPAREYQLQQGEREVLTLQQLVGTNVPGPVALQLGGRDPVTLGLAAAIGSAFGDYDSINLNCGCPSNAVGGRSGGCALMREPETVARCVEAMNTQTRELSRGVTGNCPLITVKHRLGVRDAATFDAKGDRSKDDAEAFEECSNFVRVVSLGGFVSKFHVHARLGLLGEFENDKDEKHQTLWVPSEDNKSSSHTASVRIKIDHKREQERANRRARKATIANRQVPPLRPNVVARLADEFRQFEFVSNGGIQSLSDVERIVDNGLLGKLNNRVVGGMVGRLGINHPCSFAMADQLWENRISSMASDFSLLETRRPSRGEVLRDFIRYCDTEEDRLMSMGVAAGTIEVLRRRLIAVPFHLFVGEDGNDDFQRSIKKLKNKTDKVKASSILSGAASFVPLSTLKKCVDDFVSWDDVAKYECGLKRGSAMQRIIY
mmetsp:Transcript_12876/g.23299  ORF Transcript_12876/g.23299 Transcript_12876/m.23299 type:complete len:586 (+) Transcript_12876:150-1907(+)